MNLLPGDRLLSSRVFRLHPLIALDYVMLLISPGLQTIETFFAVRHLIQQFVMRLSNNIAYPYIGIKYVFIYPHFYAIYALLHQWRPWQVAFYAPCLH